MQSAMTTSIAMVFSVSLAVAYNDYIWHGERNCYTKLVFKTC